LSAARKTYGYLWGWVFSVLRRFSYSCTLVCLYMTKDNPVTGDHTFSAGLLSLCVGQGLVPAAARVCTGRDRGGSVGPQVCVWVCVCFVCRKCGHSRGVPAWCVSEPVVCVCTCVCVLCMCVRKERQGVAWAQWVGVCWVESSVVLGPGVSGFKYGETPRRGARVTGGTSQ